MQRVRSEQECIAQDTRLNHHETLELIAYSCEEFAKANADASGATIDAMWRFINDVRAVMAESTIKK